jgi:hypothetical protein
VVKDRTLKITANLSSEHDRDIQIKNPAKKNENEAYKIKAT